jgi:hypothetical protein
VSSSTFCRPIERIFGRTERLLLRGFERATFTVSRTSGGYASSVPTCQVITTGRTRPGGTDAQCLVNAKFPTLGFSLRLVVSLNICFTAKSGATVGSSCQSRLCSSARRIPQTRAVLASAPRGCASLRGLTAPHFAQLSPTVKRMFFNWPARAKFFTTKGTKTRDTLSKMLVLYGSEE